MATLIKQRKAADQAFGPVWILDAGDYSMGTAFAAAIRETGGELQLLSRMGFLCADVWDGGGARSR
jgi:5'-nucleotidase